MLDAEIAAQPWRDYLKAQRQAFAGKLIYVSPRDQLAAVTWWDLSDAVGVLGPYSLSDKRDATAHQLKVGWQAHLGEIASIAQGANRPAYVFGIAYPPTALAARDPATPLAAGEAPALEVQERCYDSALLALQGHEIQGVFFRLDRAEAQALTLDFNLQMLMKKHWGAAEIAASSTSASTTPAAP